MNQRGWVVLLLSSFAVAAAAVYKPSLPIPPIPRCTTTTHRRPPSFSLCLGLVRAWNQAGRKRGSGFRTRAESSTSPSREPCPVLHHWRHVRSYSHVQSPTYVMSKLYIIYIVVFVQPPLRPTPLTSHPDPA